MRNNLNDRREANVRQAFTDALYEAACTDKDIIVLTSDATGSAALGKIFAELPEQFVECGIAEQDMVGIAAGIAAMGKKPFICSPAAFLSARAFEQVKVDVAYSHMNVKLIGVSGGVSYGALGESHYSVQDFAVMRAISGVEVLCPADAVQAAALAKTLVTHDKAVYLRMGRGNTPSIYEESDSFQIGKAVVCREGGDVSILAVGEQVYPALVAAEMLSAQGIEARVLDLFSVKPLDEEAIVAAAKETGAVVTVEEHSIYGGVGAAVAQILGERCPTALKCVALPNEILLCGSSAEMKQHYGLDAEGIAKAAIETVKRK